MLNFIEKKSEAKHYINDVKFYGEILFFPLLQPNITFWKKKLKNF